MQLATRMELLHMNVALARAFAIVLALLVCWSPIVNAAPVPSAHEPALRWINGYRDKPKPMSAPELIRNLSAAGAFREPESAGVYVGFLAGVIGGNPKRAREIIKRTLPLPYHDQWLIVRAVAYSGHPQWRDLLRQLAVELPKRHVMVEMYLTGKLPTLDRIPLEQRGSPHWVQFWRKQPKEAPLTFESNPDLLDTLWGYYFATGRDAPLLRLASMLPWANDKNSVEKLSAGSMVKYTLATNAARDFKLLAQLKRALPAQPKGIKAPLSEAILAAEISDTGRIRKDALAAVEELRRRGPDSKRNVAWWGGLGETAISLGCLTAAATGQVQLGLPCVIGGALSSAALRQIARPD